MSAVYLVVFALSVAAILSYVYWNTAVLLERQTDDTIRAEVDSLGEQYRQGGLARLLDLLLQRRDDAEVAVRLLELVEVLPGAV